MGKTRTEGLARWRAKVLSRFPAAAKAEMAAANQKNAEEFKQRVAAIIPKGDPANGNLVDSLTSGPTDRSEIGVQVSIGDATHPYPLHLEAGHRAANGVHVPAKPFWNPVKQVMRKRAKSRASRAMSKAIKSMGPST